MKLIIASNNKHKLAEIEQILGDKFSTILSMSEAGIELDTVEDQPSFLGNAKKKALEALALMPGAAVLADDSGLCVDALDGAPGIYSARYAGEGHDDAQNRRKLLEELKDVPEGERGAHFACAMVLAQSGRPIVQAVGKVHGSILFEERGENGFGYDSLFYYEPDGCSFAELSAERKNEVSHRRNALKMLLAALDTE